MDILLQKVRLERSIRFPQWQPDALFKQIKYLSIDHHFVDMLKVTQQAMNYAIRYSTTRSAT